MFLALFFAAATPATQPATQPATLPVVTTPAPDPVTASSAPATPEQLGTTRVRRNAVAASINPDQAALSGGPGTKAWALNGTFSTSAGLATFLTDPTPNRFVGSSLSIEPSYVFNLSKTFRVRASMRGSISWEYTPPNDPNGRRFDWSDLLVGASARMYKIPVADIDLWASYRMPIPISLFSIQAGMVTALIPGVGASRNFQLNYGGGRSMSFTLRYDFVFRKNLNVTNVPAYNTAQASGVRDPTVLTRGTDVLINGGVARGGASTDFTFTNGLTFSWSPIDVLSVTLFAGITNGFTYAVAESRDAFTSMYALPGPGRFDAIRTNIDITWTALPQLLVSTGIFTGQPPFRPDNVTLYNPLFNVEAAALNYTSFYLSLTALL